MLSAALLVLALTPAGADTIFEDGFDTTSACPAGRQLLADFAYGGDNSLRNRYNVDVTLWDNIWGHATALDAVVPFPGRSNAVPIFLNFGASTYIAAQFTVPAGAQPDTYGWIAQTEYNHEADLMAAISQNCGDFSPAAQACFSQGVGGANLVPWSVPPPTSFCHVQPGAAYYLNLKVVDASGCEAGTECVVGTANNIHIP
jgi:hypothetical protein